MKIKDIFYKIYFARYIRKNKKQLKKIKDLKKIPKSILVISNTALGDTVLSTSSLKSLKESFPHSKITLLVHFSLEKLFKYFPYKDNLVLYQGGYNNFFKTVKKIKNINQKCH